jgi:hypothetical protein
MDKMVEIFEDLLCEAAAAQRGGVGIALVWRTALWELISVGLVSRLQSTAVIAVIGMLGALAGALIVASGVALLIRSHLVMTLAQATAYVSVPVAILAGVIKHYAEWPMTVVGIALPIFLLLYCQKNDKSNGLLSKA